MSYNHPLGLVPKHFHHLRIEPRTQEAACPHPAAPDACSSPFCLRMCPSWTSHRNGVTEHVAFRGWLLPLARCFRGSSMCHWVAPRSFFWVNEMPPCARRNDLSPMKVDLVTPLRRCIRWRDRSPPPYTRSRTPSPDARSVTQLLTLPSRGPGHVGHPRSTSVLETPQAFARPRASAPAAPAVLGRSGVRRLASRLPTQGVLPISSGASGQCAPLTPGFPAWEAEERRGLTGQAWDAPTPGLAARGAPGPLVLLTMAGRIFFRRNTKWRRKSRTGSRSTILR